MTTLLKRLWSWLRGRSKQFYLEEGYELVIDYENKIAKAVKEHGARCDEHSESQEIG